MLKTGFFKLILSNYFFYFLIFLSISYLFLSQNNQLNHNISWHYDYFISFEGAYRIFIGQIPYRDFSTPVPPISFIVYGLFFKLLSPSFQTLAFIQFTINISFLAISYFILKKIIVDKYLILLSLIIFLKFYINSLNLPWYNSTAALFFITSIYFLISKSNFNILFAGIFISFTFFTKQDQGILIILFSVLLLFYENDLKQFIYKTIYILTPLLVLGFCFYFIDSDNFIKSINLFKLASAKVGGDKQLTFMLQKQFLILIFLLISMVCFKLNIKYIIKTFIIFSCLLVSITSGQIHTTLFYFFLTIPTINDLLIKYKIFKLSKKKFLTIIFILFFTFNGIREEIPNNIKNIIKSILNIEYIINKNYSSDLKSINNINFNSQFQIDYISMIRDFYSSHMINKSNTHLILTPVPISAEISSTPIKNVPLWFDFNISYSEKDVDRILYLIKNSKIDILFLDNYSNNKILNYLLNNTNYVLIKNKTNLYNKKEYFLFYIKTLI